MKSTAYGLVEPTHFDLVAINMLVTTTIETYVGRLLFIAILNIKKMLLLIGNLFKRIKFINCTRKRSKVEDKKNVS